MNDRILSLIGLAKKAGRLEVGEEPVGAAARSRHARLILVASDAAENTRRRARHFAEAGNVPWVGIPYTKEALGGAVGRSSCAMAALTDIGFASSMASKLSALDPERYGDLSSQLGEKAQRVLQRQKEQRRHEKNLQKGGKKPWAPPPKNSEAAQTRIARKKGPPERQSGQEKVLVKKGPAPKRGAFQIKGKLPSSHGPAKKP